MTWFIKYKYKLSITIGRISLPYMSLRDVCIKTNEFWIVRHFFEFIAFKQVGFHDFLFSSVYSLLNIWKPLNYSRSIVFYCSWLKSSVAEVVCLTNTLPNSSLSTFLRSKFTGGMEGGHLLGALPRVWTEGDVVSWRPLTLFLIWCRYFRIKYFSRVSTVETDLVLAQISIYFIIVHSFWGFTLRMSRYGAGKWLMKQKDFTWIQRSPTSPLTVVPQWARRQLRPASW